MASTAPVDVRHAASVLPAVHVPLVLPHSQAPLLHLFAVESHAAPPQRHMPLLQVNPVGQVTVAHGSRNMKFLDILRFSVETFY